MKEKREIWTNTAAGAKLGRLVEKGSIVCCC